MSQQNPADQPDTDTSDQPDDSNDENYSNSENDENSQSSEQEERQPRLHKRIPHSENTETSIASHSINSGASSPPRIHLPPNTPPEPFVRQLPPFQMWHLLVCFGLLLFLSLFWFVFFQSSSSFRSFHQLSSSVDQLAQFTSLITWHQKLGQVEKVISDVTFDFSVESSQFQEFQKPINSLRSISSRYGNLGRKSRQFIVRIVDTMNYYLLHYDSILKYMKQAELDDAHTEMNAVYRRLVECKVLLEEIKATNSELTKEIQFIGEDIWSISKKSSQSISNEQQRMNQKQLHALISAGLVFTSAMSGTQKMSDSFLRSEANALKDAFSSGGGEKYISQVKELGANVQVVNEIMFKLSPILENILNLLSLCEQDLSHPNSILSDDGFLALKEEWYSLQPKIQSYIQVLNQYLVHGSQYSYRPPPTLELSHS